ncbi:MAG: hypothetical protein LC670_06260, partial [Flavobacteriales bacterium]|nr:hypothetical protein [Flavobacteriales bacterium]
MTMGIYPENVVQKSTYFSANTFSDILKQPTLTFLLLLLLATTLSAQEFDIRSFEAIPNDLSARKEVRRTVNDEPCALIKVVTNIKGMQFQSNI